MNARPTPEQAPLLRVRGLVKRFAGVEALRGVDFEVHAGEVHCLLGPNGAGKSTLIRCVSGVLAPTAGRIELQGEPLPVGKPNEALARGIATIYQELDLVLDMSVVDSIFLGNEYTRGGMLDRRRMRREAREVLARLGRDEIDVDAHVRDLRPAARQTVSIARALVRDVRVLIMDEPSSILGSGEIDVLFDVVRRLCDHGVGVVYITHRLAEIARIGTRVTVLADGRSTASELPATTAPDELVGYMIGRRVEQLFPARAEQVGDVVLDVRDVVAPPLVRGVSLQVRAGELVGITGLVGSGRSELLRAIMGMDPRPEGEVLVRGSRLAPRRPDLAVRSGLGMAPEDRRSQALILDWSSGRNVTLANLREYVRGALLDRRSERAHARRELERLDTRPADPDHVVRELSGGNQQKVVLARWLARECTVLLLDEPTRGVDVGARAELYRVMRELATAGMGVLVVSSELAEVAGLCDRVLVMRDGRIVTELPGIDATEAALLRASLHEGEVAGG